MHIYQFIGILICLIHSAMFSGLTIGLFGLSRLRLEVQAEANNPDAIQILKIRVDSNFLLATLLWGNVSVNVLLTMLTDSILTGFSAFAFSTIVITFFGEIFPQAYFARSGFRAGALLVPVVKLYQFVLYPLARPTAHFLDLWLGKEGPYFFNKQEFKVMIKKHANSEQTDLGWLESGGAVNFLSLDEVLVQDVGVPLDPMSIISLPEASGRPLFPEFRRVPVDPFLRKLELSGNKWLAITNLSGKPLLVMNADRFLREAMFGDMQNLDPYRYCSRPIIVTSPRIRLGEEILQLQGRGEKREGGVINDEVILYWSDRKRIITGADILGVLLKGIGPRAANTIRK